MSAAGDASRQILDIDADRALFEGRAPALVAALCLNERPLAGLAGLMDWRFLGAISRCLRVGAIGGEAGECAYVPVSRNGTTYHLILVGAGQSASPGARQPLPPESLRALQRNLASLRLPCVALSRSDLGGASDEALAKHLKGVSLCIAK